MQYKSSTYSNRPLEHRKLEVREGGIVSIGTHGCNIL